MRSYFPTNWQSPGSYFYKTPKSTDDSDPPLKVWREGNEVHFTGRGARQMDTTVSAWNAENEFPAVCRTTRDTLGYIYRCEEDAILCAIRFKQ